MALRRAGSGQASQKEEEKSRKRSRSRSRSRDRPKRRHAKEKKEEKKKAPPEPPSFKNCGPKLKTAFEPLEQTYNLDREELEDDVKQSLFDLKDEKAASCVLALFATLQRQQLESRPLAEGGHRQGGEASRRARYLCAWNSMCTTRAYSKRCRLLPRNLAVRGMGPG